MDIQKIMLVIESSKEFIQLANIFSLHTIPHGLIFYDYRIRSQMKLTKEFRKSIGQEVVWKIARLIAWGNLGKGQVFKKFSILGALNFMMKSSYESIVNAYFA